MPDSLINLSKEVIGGVVVAGGAMLYGAYKWFFHRNIVRIDAHASSINRQHEDHSLLVQRVSTVEEQAVKQACIHDKDIRDVEKLFDVKLTALTKVIELKFTMVQEALNALVRQGEEKAKFDRREDDQA